MMIKKLIRNAVIIFSFIILSTSAVYANDFIFVGETYISSSGFYLNSKSGTLTKTGASQSNYNLYYDKEGDTIYLDGLNVSTGYVAPYGETIGIYSCGDINIVLKGKPSVIDLSSESYKKDCICLYSSGDIAISGDTSITMMCGNVSEGRCDTVITDENFNLNGSAKLIIKSGTSKDSNCGLLVNRNAVFSGNSSIESTSGASESGMSDGISVLGNFTVKDNAKVTATASSSYSSSRGIYCEGNFTAQNNSYAVCTGNTSTTFTSFGLSCLGKVTIKDNPTVKMSGGKGTISDGNSTTSCGLYSEDIFEMGGGNVTLTGAETENKYEDSFALLSSSVKITAGILEASAPTSAFITIPDLSDYTKPQVTVSMNADGSNPVKYDKNFIYYPYFKINENTAPESKITVGDTTGDGNINIDDVVILVKYVSAKAAGASLDENVFPNGEFPSGDSSCARLTADETIDISDVVILVKYVSAKAAGAALDEKDFPEGKFPSEVQ